MLPTIKTTGRLTRNVELSFLPNQTAVAKFGIACSEKYKDKETVCFLDCVCFGKSGEALAKYFTKGKPIEIVGKEKTDQWEKDGKKHSKQVVNVSDWGFVPKDNAEKDKPQQDEDIEF